MIQFSKQRAQYFLCLVRISIVSTKVGTTVITQSCQRNGLSVVEAGGNSIKAAVTAQNPDAVNQPCQITIPAAGKNILH